MKITMVQALDFNNALGTLKDLKLPIRTSFKIAQLTNEITPLIEVYQRAARDLFEKYVQKNENGEPLLDENQRPIIPLDKIEESNIEGQKLLDEVVDIKEIHFTFEEFEGVSITPAISYALLPFIVEN